MQKTEKDTSIIDWSAQQTNTGQNMQQIPKCGHQLFI